MCYKNSGKREKKWNWQKYGREGSYTVEAAFIIPVILGIIFALLYFLFYEHDKVVLQGNIQMGTMQIAREEKELPSTKEWKNGIQKNLWIGTVTKGGIEKKKLYIAGSGVVEMSWKIPVMQFFLQEKQKISISIQQDSWQPNQVVRWKSALSEESKEE